MRDGIVPVMDVNGNNNNGGFGNFGGEWAWIIIILILFGGYGRGFGGGYGFNGGGTSVYEGYVLNNDFSQLSKQISDSYSMTERKLDGLANGLCDGFYTNAQLINGVNTNILTQGNGINTNILQGTNSLNASIKDCCCTTQRSIDSVNFNNAQNTCAITNAITLSSRDIIDNQNANYKQLHDEIVNFRIEDKNNQIAMLQTKLNNAELRASQEAQSAYLLNELKPCGKPAYIVPNPNCCYNYQVSQGCGCNNGCGY